MSSPEEEFPYYGTPLEPLEEETIPKKRAFTIADQIATDAQGRRRFHGAFTGGFSAGFFNTVGSLEGWKPSQFKSSRSEKNQAKCQNPEDFMDEEDTSAFGIAPKLVRATEEFSNVKQKRPIKSDGPIPGTPVLHSLLEPTTETIGIRLLRKMGWKPGQKVGERVTVRKLQKKHNLKGAKVYGCEIPDHFRQNVTEDASSSSDEEIEEIIDDYVPDFKLRINTQGLGYTGLNKNLLQSHVNLFNESEFKMRGKNNKLISVTGTAFGVGAFEIEDDDIYRKDDMSKYDFVIEPPSKAINKPETKAIKNTEVQFLDGFEPAKKPSGMKYAYPVIIVPKNFIPKHGVKISRFEPIIEIEEIKTLIKNKNRLTAQERSVILGTFEPPVLPEIKFAPAETSIDNKKEAVRPESDSSAYLSLKTKEPEVFPTKPNETIVNLNTDTLVFDKFIPALNEDDQSTFKYCSLSVYQHGTEDMQNAAKGNRFGLLTREISEWKPNKLLCKRFNVPEPSVDIDLPKPKPKARQKSSILSYYEAYLQNKSIPLKKTTETPQPSTSETTLESSAENLIVMPTNNSKIPTVTPMDNIEIQSKDTISPKSIELPKKEPEPLQRLLMIQKSIEIPKPKFISEDINSAEKLDLYKTIFLSSSESEDENDENEKIQQKNIELKKLVTDDLAEKVIMNKKIENTGIIKNDTAKLDIPLIKEKASTSKGIFSGFDLSKVMTKPKNDMENNTGDKLKPKVDNNVYGPALPSELKINKNNTSSTFVYKEKTFDNNWVEIDEAKEKRHKKHKNKKHKEKKDKHKSKHKKKKHK